MADISKISDVKKTDFKIQVLLISLLVAIVGSLFLMFHTFDHVNAGFTDRLYGGKTALSDIVIVSIDDASIQQIGRWPWNRSIFASLTSKLAGARVIGYDVGYFEPAHGDDEFAEAIKAHGNVVLASQYVNFDKGELTEDNQGSLAGTELIGPISVLKAEAAYTGYVNTAQDADGITRGVRFDVAGSEKHFVAKIFQAAFGNEIQTPSGLFMVNFVGSPGSFTVIPASRVLAEDFGAQVKDKIVLVGSTAPSLHDEFNVPTSRGVSMPGVEVHAHTLQTLIHGNPLVKVQWWISVVIIVLLLLLVSASIIYFGFVYGGFATVGVGALYVLGVVVAFDSQYIFDLVITLGAIAVNYCVNLGFFYTRLQIQKNTVVNAFGKYVSPKVIDILLKHPEYLNLGGEKKYVTIFFSDVRGFSSFSEQLTPEKLVKLLNEYLSAMTDIVIEEEGVVDKFIGDAIMAFWGAPVDQKDHAIRACTASIKMVKVLEELNKGWSTRGFPHVAAGIGLHSGHAVIGNMGSNVRFDYTAMGDTVNLGSRLEGLTKKYGVSVLISETTKELVEKQFVVRELDRVQVKGKKLPVTIYQLVGEIGKVGEEKLNELKEYEKALYLYYKKDFKGCKKLLKNKKDNTSLNLVEQCDHFIKNKPERGWKGVWVMTSK